MKRFLFSICLGFSLVGTAHAADQTNNSIGVGAFAGLNTQDPPAAINASQAQDLLNVNLTPGGKAVFKRDGYGLFKTLPINTSTTSVHGGYHFQDSSGNDVQLWGNDLELSSIVNDGISVKLATGTVAATWQCADSQGFAYCLTSSRDMCVKTDGTVANTTFQNTVPLGTMIAMTPTRLFVAGTSANPSTISLSQENTFTNFTSGPNNTDPFTVTIAAPGSRLTHINYYFGKIFWWKDQSFGYLTCNNQYDCPVTIISNTVGTLDNSSAFWNPSSFNGVQSGTPDNGRGGGVFFRGQDNHIYLFDGYSLTRLSRIITPNVVTSNRKKANAWIQTAQSDFTAGVIVPTGQLSTSISPGDVIVSSFSNTDNSNATFSVGTLNSMSVSNNTIFLSTNDANVQNNSFETGSITNWTIAGARCGQQVNAVATTNCGSVAAYDGTDSLSWNIGSPSNFNILAYILDANTGAILSQNTFSWKAAFCPPWTSGSIPGVTSGKLVKVQFSDSLGLCSATSDSFISNGNVMSFRYFSDGASPSNNSLFGIDFLSSGRSSISSGTFVSKTFDTGLTSSTYQIQGTWTVNTATPTFSLQTSTASTGKFVDLLTSTGTNAIGNRYVRYTSTISLGATDIPGTTISTVTVVSQSTGTYYSAVNNAPNLTSWGTFGVTDFVNGASSITYYTRSSTNSFSLQSSTPVWKVQTKNTTVIASTGTFFQMKADFSLTAATETPTINDFSFNWFEGSASDKSYFTYFNDAIWISVSSGTSTSTNNRIFYYDLLNNAWLIYDIAANGFAVENNTLYFGDPVQGNIFKFGGVPTDNGSSINSYWKSKDFVGNDPFTQNEWVQSDFIFNRANGTTVNYIYTLDQKNATTIAIPLTDSASSIIKRGILLGVGKIGTFYNFQIGDNSGNPKWTLLDHRAKYNSLNWKPQTQ